jgi:hypothetical protein
MNAETLLALARDVAMWLRKSTDLRSSADVLWSAYHTEAGNWAREQGIDKVGADAAWRRAMAHLDAAKMFYALALETALKAMIMRTKPSEVQFNIRADGSGKVLFAALTQIGGSKKAGRSLTDLAAETDVFARGRVFAEDADIDAARAIVDDLSGFITWIARYPTPMSADHRPNYPVPPVSSAWGDEMRRWTDPLLDYLHGL